jgi:hypothetical protein
MEGKKFQNIRFKVLDVPKGTELLLKFPELGACDEFRNYIDGDRNYVIRYICLAYDPQSDLYKDYTDLTKIKEAAAELAEFPRNTKTGKFEDKVYRMIRMENSTINDMIIAFLKIINNHIWAQIQVNEQMFWEYARLLSEPVKGDGSKDILQAADIKKKLREEIKIIATDLEVFYKQMFGEDEDLKNVVKKKPVRPETMIKA